MRILWDIGIREQMAVIGHGESYIHSRVAARVSPPDNSSSSSSHIVVDKVNFHKSTFTSPPFFTLDAGRDWLNQTLPGGILQIQPKLGMFCSCRV